MTNERFRPRARLALLTALLALGCQDGHLDVLRATPAAGAMASPFVLDDFEDGDTQSLSIADGYWYFEPDATCSGGFGIEVVAGRSESTHAVRARGSGCSEWGALLGLDLGGVGETFDASSFQELRFWARAEPGSFATISVSLLDPAHFDTDIALTGEWQEYVLPLDSFRFNDRGAAQAFDTGALTHLQFFAFTEAAFDFWLDDLAFVRTE